MSVQPIARVSVIRGEGQCEAIVNGMVSEELRRLQAKEHAENERRVELMRKQYAALSGECSAAKAHRDALLKQSYDDLVFTLNHWKKDSILLKAYCAVYALLYGFFHSLVVRVDE